jgi:RimJ/RimL family protein N-acetyltransferase
MQEEARFPERLESERLVLRRYSSADALCLLTVVERNRDRLVQSFPQMGRGFSCGEQAVSFVEEKREQWESRKGFAFGIWHKASSQLIGQLLVKNVAWEVPSAELSYFIDVLSQRQGFASEAVATTLRIAFEQLGFKRVFVRILPSNTESALLAKKLGFQHEGLHRNEFRCGRGELHDVHYFSLTSEDFR